MGNIKIHTNYTYNEWFMINNNLDRSISSRLKFVQNQCVGSNSKSVIHLNNIGLSSQDVLDLLECLFYHIKEIQCNIFKEEK